MNGLRPFNNLAPVKQREPFNTPQFDILKAIIYSHANPTRPVIPECRVDQVILTVIGKPQHIVIQVIFLCRIAQPGTFTPLAPVLFEQHIF